MILNRSDSQQVNRELTDTIYALYLEQLWGMTVCYKPIPYSIAWMNKTLEDWWNAQDCTNQLCADSTNQPIIVVKYAVWTNHSPFPQIADRNNCCRRNHTGPCAQSCCCQPQQGDTTFFTIGPWF